MKIKFELDVGVSLSKVIDFILCVLFIIAWICVILVAIYGWLMLLKFLLNLIPSSFLGV